MIEIEKRALISKKQYNKLHKYFQANANFQEEFKRFTLVQITNSDYSPDIDTQIDLRVRTQGEDSKFTLKTGNWHSGESRNEYEIHFKTTEIENALNMMVALGGRYFVAVYIQRKMYKYGKYIITLDKYFFSEDYILEIELEDSTNINDIENEEAKILALLQELDVQVTNSDVMIKFINKLNFVKQAQVELTPENVKEWCEKWEKFIYCRK